MPFNGPWYPEDIGHLDPFVFLGALASGINTIMLGNAAIVLPIRRPTYTAKAAIGVQTLSGGLLILGVGSGDPKEEYAAFGHDAAARREMSGLTGMNLSFHTDSSDATRKQK